MVGIKEQPKIINVTILFIFRKDIYPILSNHTAYIEQINDVSAAMSILPISRKDLHPILSKHIAN